MVWLLLAVISAASEAIRAAFSKAGVKHLDPYFVAWSLIAFSLPFLLPLAFFISIPELTRRFWIVLFFGGTVDVVGTIFYMKAVKHSDLSITIPLLSCIPLFLLVLTPFINGELPSRLGLMGVLSIVAGSYVLRLEDYRFGILEPFKALLRDRGARYMILTAFLWSIASSLHKIGIACSSPVFWPVVYFSWMALLMLPVIFNVPGFSSQLRKGWKIALPVGFFTATMILSQMLAISLTLVVYVSAIKNLCALFAVLIGGMVFKEQNMRERLVGAGLMVSGTSMIVFA